MSKINAWVITAKHPVNGYRYFYNIDQHAHDVALVSSAMFFFHPGGAAVFCERLNKEKFHEIDRWEVVKLESVEDK